MFGFLLSINVSDLLHHLFLHLIRSHSRLLTQERILLGLSSVKDQRSESNAGDMTVAADPEEEEEEE